MKRLLPEILRVSLLLAVSWSASGAETRQLDIADTVSTKEPAPFIVLPVKCDWISNLKEKLGAFLNGSPSKSADD